MIGLDFLFGGSDGVGLGRLSKLHGFGSNPGQIKARCYVPARLAPQPALVVALHGCNQGAGAMDLGTGWSALADRYGFLLLYPEQRRANNPGVCFNWFVPDAVRRGSGEVESIRQMIDTMVRRHGADSSRVFLVGLSAGGAMASAMLAAYPELFAAAAIIAGVPSGCADSVGDAVDCMGGRVRAPTTSLVDHVRRASPHAGPWPRISVWHGTDDTTVALTNGDDIVRQWIGVHGLPARPTRSLSVDGYPYRVWEDRSGTPVVEQYVITGLAHGAPLAPGALTGQSGAAGPYMLDAAISSTDRIAAFFGLRDAIPEPAEATPLRRPRVSPLSDVHDLFESALRAVGVVR